MGRQVGRCYLRGVTSLRVRPYPYMKKGFQDAAPVGSLPLELAKLDSLGEAPATRDRHSPRTSKGAFSTFRDFETSASTPFLDNGGGEEATLI